MNQSERVNKLVELFFEEIPFSHETAAAKEKIQQALQKVYAELCETNTHGVAFEMILEQYGSLEKAGTLAGYSSETWKDFSNIPEVQSLKTAKKRFHKLRFQMMLISFLVVYALQEFIWFMYDIATGHFGAGIVMLAIFVMVLGVTIFLDLRLKRNKISFIENPCDLSAYIFLRDCSDQYAKRKLNAIALLVSAIALYVFNGLTVYFSAATKMMELLEYMMFSMALLQIPLFILMKNILCMNILEEKIQFHTQTYRRHMKWMIGISTAYWLVGIAAIFSMRRKLEYPANVFVGIAVIFACLILIYNLSARKKIMFKNLVFNGRRTVVALILVTAVVGGVSLQRDTWYTQPYINSVPMLRQRNNVIFYEEDSGRYKITASGEDFKILHLTDIHLGGSLFSYHKDMKALQACFDEIEYTRPDLVVVTGDLCFPMGIMSMSLNNTSSVHQFAAFMRNLGIPWCFTYGNHDTESMASADEETLDKVYQSLSYKTSGTLLYPYMQPDIMGRNNQVIEIYNTDGTLNNALFLIDSNAYTGEGINVYDYIHDDQVEWYASEVERLNKQEGNIVSSLAFFHIPLQQYRTAYELYETGSEEVTYFFGENGEKMIDKICCSDYPSKLFDTMKELGSTTGTFCGHDHYNNMSLEYQGIRLTYGMSIDYLAMPGIEDDSAQRGAELIALHQDSSWDVEQIPLNKIARAK